MSGINILKKSIAVVDRYIKVPEGPGLGVELDPAAVKFWQSREGENFRQGFLIATIREGVSKEP